VTSRSEQPLGVFDLLERIIAMSSPLEALIKQYRSAVRDLTVGNANSFVMLHVADLEQAIRQYIAGQLSANDLALWAGLLEGNELVDYDEVANDSIADVLFQLSSPEINCEITPRSCEALLAKLGGA
jgi:hypothetical protein